MARRDTGTIGFGALLVVLCGIATGADWVSLGKSANGMQETSIDVSSITGAGSVRRAWSKVVIAPHTQNLENKWVSFYLMLKAFNCEEKTTRFEATTTYYDDGSDHPLPGAAFPMPWEPVAPETVDDDQMQFLCKWKLSAAAVTHKWIPLLKADSGADILLDAANVTGAGMIWRVWQKTVPVPHSVRGAAPDASKWVDHYLTLVAFDCAKNLYRFEALTTHFEDGSDTADPPGEFPQPWEPASPGSLAGVKLDVICTAKVKNK